MAKKQGIELPKFGLNSTIRKRIDELIDLNLNPSTINLFTSEFSKIDDNTRANIGRYIAALLEVQNGILEAHLERAVQSNAFGVSKQEIILKQRKSNLLRIQRAFSSQVNSNQNQVRKNINEQSNSRINSAINVRNIMVTKGEHALSHDEQEKERLRELANKKRIIELAIFEQEQKLKLAQKQYKEAEEKHDTVTQELKLNIINESKNKINDIKNNVRKYNNIKDFPIEILMDPNQTIDLKKDEENLRKYLADKNKDSLDGLRGQVKSKNSLLEDTVDIDDFFYVEGLYECKYHDHSKLDFDEHLEMHINDIPETKKADNFSDFDQSYFKSQVESIMEAEQLADNEFEKHVGKSAFDEIELNQTIENPFGDLIQETKVAHEPDDAIKTFSDPEVSATRLNETIENPFGDLVQETKVMSEPKEKGKTFSEPEVSATNLSETIENPIADLLDEDDDLEDVTMTSEIWLDSDEKIIQQQEEEIKKLAEQENELKVYFAKLESAKKIVKENVKVSEEFDKLIDAKIEEQNNKGIELSIIEEKQKVMQEYLEKLKAAKKIAKQNELEINELWANKEKEWMQREEEKLDSFTESEFEYEPDSSSASTLDHDLIIKKIKKNSKIKDKKIERIKKERDLFEKELVELKLKQKVEELRKIEIQKLKAIENIESIEKHEKIKGVFSLDLLKEKILGHIATTTLMAKDKANIAISALKDKAQDAINVLKSETQTSTEQTAANNLDSNKEVAHNQIPTTNKNESINDSHDLRSTPQMDEEFDATTFMSRKNETYDLDNDEDDEAKRIQFLQRKVVLNIITDDEKNELDQRMKRTRTRNYNNKVNLKKFSLIVKYK